jgi:hypothetical protein
MEMFDEAHDRCREDMATTAIAVCGRTRRGRHHRELSLTMARLTSVRWPRRAELPRMRGAQTPDYG